MELSAIWLDEKALIIRDRKLIRTKRIAEGDFIGVKDGKISSKGTVHQIKCCVGNAFGTDLELLVINKKSKHLQTIKL